MKPPAQATRGRRIRLSIPEAAAIASTELGHRVPTGRIRQWKHRDDVAGGNGWVDGESLLLLLDRLTTSPAPRRGPRSAGARRGSLPTDQL